MYRLMRIQCEAIPVHVDNSNIHNYCFLEFCIKVVHMMLTSRAGDVNDEATLDSGAHLASDR